MLILTSIASHSTEITFKATHEPVQVTNLKHVQ